MSREQIRERKWRKIKGSSHSIDWKYFLLGHPIFSQNMKVLKKSASHI